jgi:hypothetical protein
MRTFGLLLLGLFILAGIANEVKAADLSDSKCHEQPEREIRTQSPLLSVMTKGLKEVVADVSELHTHVLE